MRQGWRWQLRIAAAALALAASAWGATGEGCSAQETTCAATPIQFAGAPANQREIWKVIAEGLQARGIADAEIPEVAALDYSAAAGVPAQAALELTRTEWDAVRHTLDFRLRCVRHEECIPFLVRTRVGESQATRFAAIFAPLNAAARHTPLAGQATSSGDLLVKTGQQATLIWEQSGIRIRLPVVCLEAGARGQQIRVRTQTGARNLRGEVLRSGVLRAVL